MCRTTWLYGLLTLLCSGLLLSACGDEIDTQELTVDQLKQRLYQGYTAYKKVAEQYTNNNIKIRETTRIRSLIERLRKPKLPWVQMGKFERERLMARSVMPLMLLLFENFDSQLDGNSGFGTRRRSSRAFSCLTCHGDSTKPVVDTRTFDFSSPSFLAPLDPDNLPKVDDDDPRIARITRFMKFVITPTIRILLGRKEANCFTCHAKKRK